MTRKKTMVFRAFVYAMLIVSSLLMIFPFYWTVTNSLKLHSNILASPPQWWPNPLITYNYPNLFKNLPDFGWYFFNSALVAILVTLGQAFFSTLAGYAFAKLRFPGRNALFFALLLGMMVPFQVNLIPLYKIMDALNWLDTYWALILPNIMSVFSVFLMRQFIKSIPDELLDAARIDGCGEFGVFWRVALPLALPGTATLVIFSFMSSWNSFLWPRIVTSSDRLYTLPVGLTQLQLRNTINYGEVLAGTTLVALPMILLFLFMQRQFIEGMTAGAVKE